jgi:hypothetical protein
MADTIFETKAARVYEEYLPMQVEVLKSSDTWSNHKAWIALYDRTYQGNLTGLTAEENKLPDIPYIENKLKNATHDIKRLAREARGVAVFAKRGEDDKESVRAKLRSVIVDTIWAEGGGQRNEGRAYFDIIRGGFVATAVFKKRGEPYAQFLRLDPAFSYPTLVNGKLEDLVYIETMKQRAAAALFPDSGLKLDPKNTKDCQVVMVFTKDEVVQGIVVPGVPRAMVVDRWIHKLGRVPVGFREMETADGRFHGLLDQLHGPMKGRNKAVRLMLDYLEDMVHAPWEEKGIENGPSTGNLPGPTTYYIHDRDAETETFVRRTQPAAPAGAVFGLMGYLDAQEQAEGFQPPSRVGIVRQSQASGNFVESTQGSLSSVVFELQGYVADWRRECNTIAMMIEERFLNKEKPLIRAVGERVTYKPKDDIAGWYFHKIMFGAAAGLDRREADSRILQHLGAGLIPLEKAREQIDYIENDTDIADEVQRDLLSKVMFQRLTNDQTVTFADQAAIWLLLGEGKSWYEALKEILPQLLEGAAQRQAAAAGSGILGQGGPQAQPQTPQEQALALQKGATPGVSPTSFKDLNPQEMLNIFGGQQNRAQLPG